MRKTYPMDHGRREYVNEEIDFSPETEHSFNCAACVLESQICTDLRRN